MHVLCCRQRYPSLTHGCNGSQTAEIVAWGFSLFLAVIIGLVYSVMFTLNVG